MVLRVAVVDDEDVQRAELVSMVERFAREGGLDIATVEFSDGRDLLASGDADKLDIILLDIEMADVDGMKAARRLRTAGVTESIGSPFRTLDTVAGETPQLAAMSLIPAMLPPPVLDT